LTDRPFNGAGGATFYLFLNFLSPLFSLFIFNGLSPINPALKKPRKISAKHLPLFECLYREYSL